jgi:hypothetical protein
MKTISSENLERQKEEISAPAVIGLYLSSAVASLFYEEIHEL